MESDKILITNKTFQIDDTLDKIDNYLADVKLAPKDNLHLRLLSEETLGMLGAMAGEYSSVVWFEKDGDICRSRWLPRQKWI